MTSDTSPSGKVIYSSQYSGQPAYYAFNQSYKGTWSAANSTYLGAWIGYQFTSSFYLKEVKFTQRNLSGYNGNCTAKIQASNDGTNWIDLTTTLSFSQLGTSTLIWTINSTIKYNYYRLYYLTGSSTSLHPTTAGLDFIGFE